MRVPSSGLRIDDASFPLLQAHIAYWGVTTGLGSPLGTTLVCADLDNHPSYVGNRVKVLTGGAWGQDRQIVIHAAGGIETVDAAFTNAAGAPQQIVAGTLFVILSNPGGGGGGGGGMPPTAPLWMFGIVSPAQVGSLTVIDIPHLAGFQDNTFNGEFYMQILDADGAAPEGETKIIQDYIGATGRFTTDAFSANVEAGDIVAIFHKAITTIDVIGRGTLTVSSTTVPADGGRAALYAWENNEYFKGCLLMPTEGVCRFQPRPIRSSAVAGGVFALDEPFSQAPGLVDYVIIGAAYPVQRLLDIFNLVNAMLVTTETGGTLTTTGAVQNVYINNAPAGVYEPLKLMIDFTNQTVAESVVVSVYYRIRPAGLGGNLILKDQVTFAGVQTPPLKNIELEPNRYGVQITLQRIAGVAKDYDWSVIYRV